MLLTTDRASVAGRVVLVTGQVTHFIDTVCAVREAPTASTTCTAGWLADTDERVYVSGYTRQLEHLVAPDDPMTGTMAFKVLPDGLFERDNGLEYLGRMGSGADGNGFQATLAELRSPWDASHALATFIVSGWLVAAQNMRCAAPAGPTPPPDTPFSGCGKAWLTPTPEQVMTVAGNEALFTPPMDGVMVQLGAYQDFARDPSTEFVREPRYGTYVVRLVVDTREGASDRVGWQVVARLDAGSTSTAPPSATPPTNTGVRIYTTAELVSSLTSDRKSLEGKAVLVAGTVTRRPVGDSCDVAVAPGGSSRVCLFGALDGTSEDVYASSYAASLTAAPPGESLAGTFALRVLPGGLEFLSGMGHGPGGVDFTASIPELVRLAVTKPTDTTSSGFIVVGWLVATPPLRCPPESPAPVPDTPFGNCESAWLLPVAEQITTITGNSMSVVPPNDGIRVQWSAYADYAPNPSTTAVPEPRHGAYLVRLVVDTRQGPDGPVGWQVVARLAP